jgi:membrane protease subunit HflK
MHAKADMFASLLTGLSLILYAMGVNIDRWMAGAIAVIILCLALDTFVNAYRVYRDKNGDSLYTYRFLSAFLSVFSLRNLKRLPRYSQRLLANCLGESRNVALLYQTLLAMPFVAMLVCYGSTAFYTVSANETAIVERFGKPLKGDPVPPGLHMKLPWPMDSAIKVRTATIEQLNIGNVSAAGTRAYLWTRKHGTEEAFLAGDNNFFYPYIILHYRIGDPFQYLYNNANPRQLLNETGHRVAVSLFARESFYDIATTDRGKLQEKMKQEIQAALKRHQSGLELINVNFRDIHPPITIAKAFENVIAGFQKKQERINQALGYANNVVPDARGDAEKRIQSAAGQSVMRQSNAEGNAKRFELRLPATEAEKQLSMLRIYHETMREALKGKTKIIVDPDVGTPDVWINFSGEKASLNAPQTRREERMGGRRMNEERTRYEER